MVGPPGRRRQGVEAGAVAEGRGVQDHRPLPHRREVSQPRGDHEGQVRVGEHGPLGRPVVPEV